MINRELINPQSIVVVGGSNNVHKPGGRLVRNLLDGKYKGELYVVNAKEDDVQGLKSYHSVHDIRDGTGKSFLFPVRPVRKLWILTPKQKTCVRGVHCHFGWRFRRGNA
ncbi:MAG: CoA-binding protein [Parabacteroides merdae]